MSPQQSNLCTLVGAVLQQLTEDADAVLLIAKSLDDQVAATDGGMKPQKLRELAALVKSAALALGMASANIVGAAERLSLVAALAQLEGSGSANRPS